MNDFIEKVPEMVVDYVKAIHKLGEIDKLFKIPQEIYDSEYGEVGATSLKILRCWIG